MTRTTNRVAGILAAATLALALAAPSVALARWDNSPGTSVLPAATTPIAAAPAPATAAPVTTSAVASADLAADLAYMREEEKLAHDVYTVLAEKWGTRVFSNIAVSEQRHTDSLATLLDRYGVADPADGTKPGVYSNDDLQKLYNDLVARGLKSQTEAFEVGKLIEEVDIADLDERIARTDEADVLAVYKNLRAGSVNHLRAFTNQLAGGGSGGGQGGGGGGRGNGGGQH